MYFNAPSGFKTGITKSVNSLSIIGSCKLKKEIESKRALVEVDSLPCICDQINIFMGPEPILK